MGLKVVQFFPTIIGLPVISTFHAGIPELIKDRETGFLVKEDDYNSVCGNAEFILNNVKETHQICKRGRTLLETKFDLRKTISQVESVFEQVLLDKR